MIWRRWSDDDIKRLRAAWAEGLSPRDIAAELGRSPGCVSVTANRLGLPARQRHQIAAPRPKMPTAKVAPPPNPAVTDEPFIRPITRDRLMAGR